MRYIVSVTFFFEPNFYQCHTLEEAEKFKQALEELHPEAKVKIITTGGADKRLQD